MSEMQKLAAKSDQASALLKELANQSRLMICCILGDDELSVGAINAQVPLSQSALSQHLARLREAEIVRTRKEKQTVYYSLNGDDAKAVIAALKSIYCP